MKQFIMIIIVLTSAACVYAHMSEDELKVFNEIHAILSEHKEKKMRFGAFDYRRAYLRIVVGDLNGSDSSCAEAGRIYRRLCELMDGKIILDITPEKRGDFIATALNPMDLVWAKYIDDPEGSPEPIDNRDLERHSMRVSEEMRDRGID